MIQLNGGNYFSMLDCQSNISCDTSQLTLNINGTLVDALILSRRSSHPISYTCRYLCRTHYFQQWFTVKSCMITVSPPDMFRVIYSFHYELYTTLYKSCRNFFFLSYTIPDWSSRIDFYGQFFSFLTYIILVYMTSVPRMKFIDSWTRPNSYVCAIWLLIVFFT